MAQAARLSVRMHKELKLLLTDPPPGAFFPTLSDDHSFSSLTSIDALFQGPQGTVYANGVFKIKIQIPERYPFQPPVVTFATPIYHPNIDNGGRICLDILNLPPKGTWQPSLNISTVLTSIGLLLSEPNPDDGLMHEASREYKYNRQAFDQNARSMTEKYARAGESESSGGSHGSQIHTGPSTAQTGTEGSDASTCTERFLYHERFKGGGSKLSLESLQSSNNWNSGKEIYRDPGGLTESNSGSTKYNEIPGKSQAMRNKMSLAVSRSRHGISLPSQHSSMLDTKTTSNDTPEYSSPLVEVGSKVPNIDEDYIERSSSISVCQEQQSLHCAKMGQSRDSDEKLQSVSQNEALSWSLCTSHNKTNPPKTDVIARKGSAGLKKTGLGEDEKENFTPVQLTDQSAANGMYSNERTGKHVTAIGTLKLSEAAVKLPLKPVDQLLGSDNNAISHSENSSGTLFKFLQLKNDVGSDEKQQINQLRDGESTDKFKQVTEEGSQIVLDSEDSEDENVRVRSKLSLPRRCLSRKRKGNLASYR